MSSQAIEKLCSAFAEDRPVVLFMGQGGSDDVLRLLLKHLGLSAETCGWKDVLSSSKLNADAFHWLSERFERRVPSEATEEVFDLAWSGVFTSSLDHKILSCLETRGRIPETVLASDHFARAPRSKSRPAVHYLFGRALDSDQAIQPPRNLLEFRKRLSGHAIPLLNRIRDTATPLGTVVIDGYFPESDWLAVDELLAPLSEEPMPMVLWFGAGHSDSEFVRHMEAAGMLIREPRALAELIGGALRPSVESLVFSSVEGTISLGEGRFFNLPPSLRLRTEAVAAVVDDTWTDHPDVNGPAPTEELFSRFHGDFGGPRATIEGVLRKFAIERDFESTLFSATENLLRKSRDVDSYLIVHGQSGTGKSIALARLAVRLRTELKVPVLFSWGRVPLATELDDFCKAAEAADAVGTVVLCDGSHRPERYQDLTFGLKSKGRRTVVVGTSYRIENIDRMKDSRYIYAPEFLSSGEVEQLSVLLRRFGFTSFQKSQIAATGQHFLPLLYRYLAASRARLAGGVSNEAHFTEGTIRIRAKNAPKNRAQSTLLAEKLIAAGLGANTEAIFDDDDDGGEADAASRLIDYVMAAGRLDCAVPVNLLIRSLQSAAGSSIDIHQIAHLFLELDLFRWKTGDTEGNSFWIQPRLQLEADLICKRRLGDTERELACLLALISSVRSSSVDEESEVQFLLDLVQKLHRDGPRSTAYKAGYLRIGRALTTLRVEHQVSDARLMLQESAFRRAALYVADKPDADDALSDNERDEILNEAREVVELALAGIAAKKLRAGRQARQNFAVERASIYGFLAVGLAKRKANEQEIWSNYLAARTAIQHAVSSEKGYHSFDVGLWTPADILKEGTLSGPHSAELRADIFSMLDQAAIGNEDRLGFHTRKVRVAPLLNNAELSADAFAALEKINPPVAYFLTARGMVNSLYDDPSSVLTTSDVERARSAVTYLEERFDSIRTDVRCLQLLLHLKWIVLTEGRLFSKDRSRIPTDRSEQQAIYRLVVDLNFAAGEGAKNGYRLLQAALEWLVGTVSIAREQFRLLSHDSDFEDSARVLRRLLLEGEGGKGFVGKILRKRGEDSWEVQVSGFTGTVDLLTRDFRADDPRVGRDIRNFNIAFNYLGPIADPNIRHGDRT